MMSILRALHDLDLVGADIVECNPLYDGPGAITALLGATVAAEILAMIAVLPRRR
jgi:agmatinase